MAQETRANPDVLEVAFAPTVDDHVEALRAAIQRGRRPWALVVMVLVLGVNVVTGFVKQGAAALYGSAAPALLVLALGTAAYRGGPVFARWAFARRARREPGLLAPMAFRFGSDGVRVQSAGGVTKLPWNAVVGVRETKRLFFFEIGSNSSLFVPRRVLSGPDASRLRRLLVARMGPRAQVHETDGR